MRAVVVHDSDSLGRSTRRMVLGAGLECRGDDFIPYEALENRLARGDAGVIVVRIGANPHEAVQLATQAVAWSQSPVFAIGPLNDESLARQLTDAGAKYLKDDGDMQAEFDTAVDSLTTSNGESRRKGKIITVFAPTSGSGGTTLAINLAGALSAQYPQGVVLVEMGRGVADIPTRLNYTPDVGTNQICRRWEQLDSTSLAAGLTIRQPGNLRVLAHKTEEDSAFDDDPIHPMAVRRVGVLMRTNYPFSVWKVDSTVDEECLQALKLSDHVLMVIRPDVLCVRQAQLAQRMADAHGIDTQNFQLLVNRWGQPGQLTRRQIEKSLGQTVAHLIPDEPKIANRAMNRGQFFHEVSRSAPITRRIAKLAKSIEQVAR